MNGKTFGLLFQKGQYWVTLADHRRENEREKVWMLFEENACRAYCCALSYWQEYSEMSLASAKWSFSITPPADHFTTSEYEEKETVSTWFAHFKKCFLQFASSTLHHWVTLLVLIFSSFCSICCPLDRCFSDKVAIWSSTKDSPHYTHHISCAPNGRPITFLSFVLSFVLVSFNIKTLMETRIDSLTSLLYYQIQLFLGLLASFLIDAN